jgi:hypothetical protein
MSLDPTKRLTPPNLAELMVRYVNRPVDAETIAVEAGALGEVEPHEVAVGFRADPRLAWREGLAVAEVFGLKDELKSVTSPSEWAGVVVRDDAAATQPCALGGYPQRVRDLTALLQATELRKLTPTGVSRPASPALGKWATKQVQSGLSGQRLLAAGVLRAAGDYEQAESVLNDLRKQMPKGQESALRNEEAALLWQRGNLDNAAEIWDQLPDSPAVLFNRGMAALFLGHAATARECLKKAVAGLPESGGWHHLGSLYLALAEMRT